MKRARFSDGCYNFVPAMAEAIVRVNEYARSVEKGEVMSDSNIVPVQSTGPLTIAEMQTRSRLITAAMKGIMQEGQHYGKIPGCGDKPALLKSGAEKLLQLFQLRAIIDAQRDIDIIEMPNGHREYRITCHILSGDGMEWGTGLGECSTMESKYRFRWDNTGQEVPGKYWKSRDPEVLGGPQFVARKSGGSWMIYQKVEHDNPADYFNTVLKMAKKRALVDGTITATSASDMFTQDIEETVTVEPVVVTKETPKAEPVERLDDATSYDGSHEGGAPQAPKYTKYTPKPKGDIYEMPGVMIREMRYKKGQTGTKPWTVHFIVIDDANGTTFATYDEALAETAQLAKENGIMVDLTYTREAKGLKLQSITDSPNSSGSDTELEDTDA